MGVKVKAGMWCDYCALPVAGQKSTHRLRNGVAAVLATNTGGLSLFGARVDGYHCPICGQPVRAATRSDFGATATPTAPREPERTREEARAFHAKERERLIGHTHRRGYSERDLARLDQLYAEGKFTPREYELRRAELTGPDRDA